MCAASLAHHGLLFSMERLGLRNIDLSSVPAQHLSSLVSCVISYLSISNVSGCDLVSLLTSIKCQVLTIRNQSLGREETKALLQAMVSVVKERLNLCNVDLSPVPAQFLASLASCVTRDISISNVSGWGRLLTSLKLRCDELYIQKQNLGKEETQALVQAMESGVKRVMLANEVKLDIETLTKYSGQGVCSVIYLYVGQWCSMSYTEANRYGEELRTWAGRKNWGVTTSDDGIKVEGGTLGRSKCSRRTLSKQRKVPRKN